MDTTSKTTTNTTNTTVETTTTRREMTAEVAAKVKAIPTMSGKIRFLAGSGWTRGDIAHVLQIRYQWVRNVMITPVKKPKA